MKFGKIDKLLLFGGGKRVVNLINVSKKYQVKVFSNERLLNELFWGTSITLKNYLEENKVTFYSIHDINIFDIDRFLDSNTLGISLGAPWIFKKDFISKFGNRLINSHGSRLPQDKGGGGFSWRILQGDKFGYYLFHIIDIGIDTGNIIFYEEYLFPDACKKPIDYLKYHEENELMFFENFLSKIESNYDFQEIRQQRYFGTYFPRLNTMNHGYINWSWQTEDIVKFICAFDDPYPGASTFLKKQRVFIKDVFSSYKHGTFHPFMSGIIYRKNEGRLYVATSQGTLVAKKVIDGNRNDILSAVKEGERFYTPYKYLDDGMEYIAQY